eukprot:TRINITY_DN23156_c0_g1_i1.p1 TRINITY_DN23156_c0_g1~~TRINITY_DN23156_c0_g1_i1.p1  ORF type:complete len:869 (+),score=170.34 TRINITY_DN23156_c0_g1_i1:59-2608(+)
MGKRQKNTQPEDESASWSLVNGVPYRHVEVYKTEGWRVTERDVVKGGMEGGYVGASVRQGTTGGVKFFTWTGCGDSVGEWVWRGNEPRTLLISWGWLPEDKISTLGSDGAVVEYDLFGTEVRRSPMLHNTQAAGSTVLCGVVENCFAVAFTMNFVIKLDLSETTSKPILVKCTHFSPFLMAVSCKGVVHASTNTEAKMFWSDPKTALPNSLPSCSLVKISPSGGLVAKLSDSGVLSVTPTEDPAAPVFEEKIPLQNGEISALSWCGNDAVVLVTCDAPNYSVSLVVPGGFRTVAKFRSNILTVTEEAYCCKIFHDHGVDLLQRAPSETVNIFGGKPSNGMLLFQAFKRHQKHDPMASKLLRKVPSLAKGYRACIHAALHSFDEQTQKDLLGAASLGKAYFKGRIDGAVLGNACAELRVLNAVRAKEVGMFLLYPCFAATARIKGVVRRLVDRRLYGLSLALAEYSGMHTGSIATSWGIWQVNKNTEKSDKDLADHIAGQLKPYQGLSRVPLVKEALSIGRAKLASLLLDAEPDLDVRVQQTIQLGEYEKALDVSINACDPALTLYCTLTTISANTDKKLMYIMLKDRPFALRHYAAYCEQRNTAALHELYAELGHYQKHGFSVLKAAHDPRLAPNSRNLIRSIKEASDLFSRAGKPYDVEVKILDSQTKLLNLQEDLVRKGKFRGEGGGMSLRNTLRVLLQAGDIKMADSLRKDHGMGDRNYWYIKVTALCETGNYKELEAWGLGKGLAKLVANKIASSSPIGYDYFVTECMRFGHPEEALKYIPKIADYARRAEAYCETNEFNSAIDTAKEYFDPDVLLAIRYRTNDPAHHKRIDEARAYLLKQEKPA